MSEGDNKQDDKNPGDESADPKAGASEKPGPVRKKTIVGMAPVGGSPDASKAPKPKGTLIGMAAVDDAEVAADKKAKAKGTLVGMAAVGDAEVAADKKAKAKGTLVGMAAVGDAEVAADKSERLAATEDEPAEDEPAEDEPAADEPAADEPAADEPAADEPAADEPAADEPAADEPAEDEPAEDEPAEDEPEAPPALYLAEFETPDAIVHAAEKVRDAGYTKWDCHTPYALHGLDQAMGLAPTKIGVISFVFGLTGVLTAFLLMYCTNGLDDTFLGFTGYRAIVGGKPPGAFPSMVPILFELGILLCGLSTLFGLLGLAKLPRHHHPVFSSERFARATHDRYFISIEAADDNFDLEGTRALLESTDPSFLELVEEDAA